MSISSHCKPLTSQSLVREFGDRTTIAGDGIRAVLRAIEEACVKDDAMLFARQSYYALLVNMVLDRLFDGRRAGLLSENQYSWCMKSSSESIGRLRGRLADVLTGYGRPSPDEQDCDLFKALYQDVFPRSLRRRLGEYYTPDWLAGHVLDQVGYAGDPNVRLLDPSCGSGTFLLMALRRWKKEWRKRDYPLFRERFGEFPIVGLDRNPLAVLTARANYLIAVADMLPEQEEVEIPVYLCDSILGNSVQASAGKGVPASAGDGFDCVAGNPPWIAWDNLPDEYRQSTKGLWEKYGLFSLSGNEARHGGGKKDLSMLMLYVAADRYLRSGGRLGMVITQTVFQTRNAGDGFRRFRLGNDGEPLGVLRVDDMSEMRPFGDASNWTATVALQKGVSTEFPVPYFRWHETKGHEDRGADCIRCFAGPIDPARPGSPWLVSATDQAASGSLTPSAAEYVARLGANTGGANGVYWVEVLEKLSAGLVRIRNIAARGKHGIEVVEHAVESDLIFPLMRWSDVQAFSAKPSGHILLTQDPATRTGISEAVMQERYPHALEYVGRFRELLVSRAAYRRYQQNAPFYSMYNVGPYTVAPVKVVWRRMDRRMNAAVVEELNDPLLGRRPVVPQETCVLVACDSAEEAYYLCSLLNSATVNELVSSCSVRGGKSFGTPGMLNYIPLRRFMPDDWRHAELAELGRLSHAEATQEIQRDIDMLAAETLSRSGVV